MKTVIVTLVATSLLAVAGCTTQHPIGTDFGNATKQNLAVQIANPEVSTKAPTHDGAYTTGAVMKYRQGLVAAPKAEATTDSQN